MEGQNKIVDEIYYLWSIVNRPNSRTIGLQWMVSFNSWNRTAVLFNIPAKWTSDIPGTEFLNRRTRIRLLFLWRLAQVASPFIFVWKWSSNRGQVLVDWAMRCCVPSPGLLSGEYEESGHSKLWRRKGHKARNRTQECQETPDMHSIKMALFCKKKY